ncbi:Uma2 family endonuclease [Roseofilum reptotaenium CS-1145]|uniref:Putative restriction endonuclease domain-containing protein n=1 Tax=Roseofilum reptotaenium AO1-A TaxID=1925591 RepID=A0A1L9QU22_9CYAN|nr:Uma2 family endonuclease [Roseofilum reptotaenium]MDB9518353.1 Uma2 family endonuclease [Roseofilum reptotaenium CS-1145]OJJ26149.1 hypothetical protein BI308_08185 [Roseofilum reptotaenium AO1-A]
MPLTLQLQQLDIPPGQRLLIHDLNWEEFEQFLIELGEKRASRIAYSHPTLEIRMPLAKHERAKSFIGDMVKILLEELEIDFECFGSTTFKRKKMGFGLEPDDCFYIDHHQQMIGKDRIDLAIDPPPDSAIEVDVTSKTQTDAYLRLGVPELWIYGENELKMYVLEDGEYKPIEQSKSFPEFPIADWVKEGLKRSYEIGRSPALREFRQQIRLLENSNDLNSLASNSIAMLT